MRDYHEKVLLNINPCGLTAMLIVTMCSPLLQVSDCLLYESAANESKPDTPSKMPHDTAKYDVKFSTEGGDIEIHPEESSTSLNFKRAILSLVTSTFRKMPETQTVTLQVNDLFVYQRTPHDHPIYMCTHFPLHMS